MGFKKRSKGVTKLIVPRHKGPVAEWSFEDGPVQRLTWPTLSRSLSSCATIISILSRYRLLFPNRVRLYKWMRACECEVAQSERVEKSEISLPVDPLRHFEDVVSLCHTLINSEAVYPL